LTKAEFVDRIAGDFDNKKAAADAVDAVLDGIGGTLVAWHERLGELRERITIAASRVPRFSAGAGLKSRVKG